MFEKLRLIHTGSLGTILAAYQTILNVQKEIDSEELDDLCVHIEKLLRVCHRIETSAKLVNNVEVMGEIVDTFGRIIEYLVRKAFKDGK